MFNDGSLPENWTTETLFKPHKSVPYNPLIANVYFLAGFIESWGRGIEKMVTACVEDGIPKPEFDVASGDIKLLFTTIPERVFHLKRENTTPIKDIDLGHSAGQNVLDGVLEKTQVQYGVILTKKTS
jgi:ATP-dependent DNA helicase RecG